MLFDLCRMTWSHQRYSFGFDVPIVVSMFRRCYDYGAYSIGRMVFLACAFDGVDSHVALLVIVGEFVYGVHVCVCVCMFVFVDGLVCVCVCLCVLIVCLLSWCLLSTWPL